MTEKEISKIKIFKHRLTDRIGKSYFLRFHMFMILSATILSGVLCSKILVHAGLHSMPLRYGIAIAFSYLLFFLFIKLWLLYIGVGINTQLQIDKKFDSSWTTDVLPVPDGLTFGGGDTGTFAGFQGGASGGSGAGGSFAESIPPGEGVTHAGSGSGAFADAGCILDEGDDSVLTLIAIVLLVIIVLSIFVAGGYLIWSAPVLLSDAAFHALLVAGVARKVRQPEETHWQTAIFKATWWMFLLVLVLSLAFGIVAQMVFPDAVTIKDFIVFLL